LPPASSLAVWYKFTINVAKKIRSDKEEVQRLEQQKKRVMGAGTTPITRFPCLQQP
jgi:hypothetical protein